MKFMSRKSWCRGWPDAAPAPTMSTWKPRGFHPHTGYRCCGSHHPRKETPMKTWQTPAATDLRFGFEITMYVAAR